MREYGVWVGILLIAAITAATRFLPFLLWGGKRKPPQLIERLGKKLPYAVMGMLVVYCLKDVNIDSLSGFLPEVLACAVVAALYIWKRNTLLSILLGTVFYMLLVQKFF